MSDSLSLNISRAKSNAVGPDHGITPSELTGLASAVTAAHAEITADRNAGKYGFYDLYKDRAMVEQVKSVSAKFQEKGYENLVILGIGGSALGITAMHTALCPPFDNLRTRAGRKGRPRLFVMDNIDPDTFKAMLQICKPEKTLYNIISKSGGTAETISQAMIVLEQLEKKLGVEGIKDHVVVTTSPRGKDAPKSLLHPVADAYGLTSFDIPLNVGGRFSIFSPVGLFPAAMMGIDIDELMAGCAAMDARCQSADLNENPAYLYAALHHHFDTTKDKPMAVMMPYSDGLRDVADWFRQLWAESLGKRYDRNGAEAYTGQTPINALGATDQHSQVQLYREGPNDKLFTLIELKKFSRTLRIPDVLSDISELDYLRGKSMNKLMAAELQGTADALKESGRPVVRITIPKLNANTFAQLLYLLEVATDMAGRLYNINAFDQPGVEEGKNIARRLMGGQG